MEVEDLLGSINADQIADLDCSNDSRDENDDGFFGTPRPRS